MASSESLSDHLIALSGHGKLQQLSAALQQPTTAQIALESVSILIDAQTGAWREQLNLQLMLDAAAKSGQADVVEALLDFGQHHNIAVSTMITVNTIDAALGTDPLPVLLKFQAVDPDIFSRRLHHGLDLLSCACRGGPSSEACPRNKYLGLIQRLLNLGFDPNASDRPLTARGYRFGQLLYSACGYASCAIVECFLQHGAVIEGSRAMRSASYSGRIDVLEVLLKHGADVNEATDRVDVDGPPGTALHAAATAGREDVVRWLLAHGADATVKNSEGVAAGEILEQKGIAV